MKVRENEKNRRHLNQHTHTHTHTKLHSSKNQKKRYKSSTEEDWKSSGNSSNIKPELLSEEEANTINQKEVSVDSWELLKTNLQSMIGVLSSLVILKAVSLNDQVVKTSVRLMMNKLKSNYHHPSLKIKMIDSHVLFSKKNLHDP
ncbi:hypothetical protein PR048_022145, partial [Dryococelus australis]